MLDRLRRFVLIRLLNLLARASTHDLLTTKMLLRKSLSLFLHGDGIEIGALHQPLSLEGLRIDRIRYIDRLTTEQLRQHYPELSQSKFVNVDVIDDGEALKTFEAGSLDFIVANHFIEHAHNPIGVLQNWLDKLGPHGHIFLAVPDKRIIFDRRRPTTSLQHLIDDFQLAAETRMMHDREHYLEYAQLVDEKQGDAIQLHVDKLISTDYSIHFHTFTPQSFLQLLLYMRDTLKLGFAIKAFVETLPNNDEFVVLLEKAAAE